jgi:mannose-6-phosphate isomerase-like protein (cupin superfamily)
MSHRNSNEANVQKGEMAMHQVENFVTALSNVSEHWSPKVVGQVNDQYVKVAKLLGQLVWHKHDNEDELFYIVKGSLRIEYEDRYVDLNAGDFHVVPKATMHNPVADEECWIVLIETISTKHTGDAITDRTRNIEDQLT